ncbi:hypothetical protein SFUMM280S_03436 [Streptomyces fumanus]
MNSSSVHRFCPVITGYAGCAESLISACALTIAHPFAPCSADQSRRRVDGRIRPRGDGPAASRYPARKARQRSSRAARYSATIVSFAPNRS